MLVGMGVVFSFLVLMVVLMRVSGALLSKLPEPEPVMQQAGKQASSKGNRAPGSTNAAATNAAAAKVAVALAAAYRAKRGS